MRSEKRVPWALAEERIKLGSPQGLAFGELFKWALDQKTGARIRTPVRVFLEAALARGYGREQPDLFLNDVWRVFRGFAGCLPDLGSG